MEFCEKKGLIPKVTHGKMGKPILKDFQDCVKEYLDESDEIRYRAEEIMIDYGVLCIRLPPYGYMNFGLPLKNDLPQHIRLPICTEFLSTTDFLSTAVKLTVPELLSPIEFLSATDH